MFLLLNFCPRRYQFALFLLAGFSGSSTSLSLDVFTFFFFLVAIVFVPVTWLIIIIIELTISIELLFRYYWISIVTSSSVFQFKSSKTRGGDIHGYGRLATSWDTDFTLSVSSHHYANAVVLYVGIFHIMLL